MTTTFFAPNAELQVKKTIAELCSREREKPRKNVVVTVKTVVDVAKKGEKYL